MADEHSRSTRRTVLKGLALGTALCMAGTETGAPALAAPARRRRLPRSAPEALGVEPAAVLAFVEAAERQFGGLHSFMLLRHGRVAAEGWWQPYGPQIPHELFSLSKSFTSTGVGFAVAEGKLTVDAPVLSFFPQDAPATVSDNLKAMRVRHLLSMSTGHDKDATGPAVERPDGNWAAGFLAQPVEHEPGTHFVYNSAATYMLSAIVQRVTGMKLLDYLQPRLFGPLGIEGATWETCPRGVNTGGWGLSVKTEDIARFGQLYLQKGVWDGRRLLPEAWIEEATSKQVSNGSKPESDWEQGYGYQFWRCRHGAYRGDGAFGQYCVVMPQQDAVLAITSGLGDMQAALNLVWDHLLPGMKEGPLPETESAEGLKRRLDRLSLRPQEGSASSPTARRVSGRTFRFEPNDQRIETLTLKRDGRRTMLVLKDDRAEHSIECGSGRWARGITALDSPGPRKVAASGAWTDADTFVAKLCFYESPFCPTITCRFGEDQVTYSFKANVGFGPTERPPLTGRISPPV